VAACLAATGCAASDPVSPDAANPTPETAATQPDTTEPVPETTAPPPETTEPVPETTEPVPETTEPVPETTEPAPGTTEPVPETTEPAPDEVNPSSDSGAVSTTEFAASETHLAFVFDASGSMNAALESSTRLDVARTAIAGVASGLESSVNTGLWAFGHRLPDSDPATCQDIENLVPIAAGGGSAISAAVAPLVAQGDTPISESLTIVADALPDNGRRSIVLVSDGEETCGGDPCATAAALAEAGVDLVVHTIGFSVNDVAREQLTCIADVTGGTYADADDSDALSTALEDATGRTSGTTLRIEASDSDDQSSLLVDVLEPGTNTYATYEDGTTFENPFFTFDVSTGLPSVVPVAPGTWDVVVGTQPKTVFPNVVFPENSETVISIAQGELQLTLDYPNSFTSTPILQVQSLDRPDTLPEVYFVGDPGKFLAGAYEVTINTEPPTVIEVEIGAGELVDVVVELAVVTVTPKVPGETEYFEFRETADGPGIARGSFLETEVPHLVPPGDYFLAGFSSDDNGVAVEITPLTEHTFAMP